MLDHSLLLTDLYQLSMMEVYARHGMRQAAAFELFVRKLPPRRGFLMMAGLEQLVDFLEAVRYSSEELDWLRSTALTERRRGADGECRQLLRPLGSVDT